MNHSDRLEFWDIIKKCQNEFDCLDAGILFGILAQKSYKIIGQELAVHRNTIWLRRRKIRKIIQRKFKNDVQF